MSAPAFGGVAAIAGIGQTEFSRRAGRSELQLACESITAALADAGLQPADVDGLVSYTVDPVEETELVRSVGFPEIVYSSRIPYGGGGSMGVLLHAASAVASGAADVVVGYRAIRARSGASRFGGAKTSPSPTSAHSGTTAMQWCMPYGVLTPASWMALNSTRYMHEFGVTSEDFGRAVVQLRAYAATNPNAWGYERPDHARGASGVALDRRAVHPPPRLLPGDRRFRRGGGHLGRARGRPRNDAGAHRRRERRRSLRTGDRDRPLPPGSLGDGRFGGARRPAVRPVRHRPRRDRRGDDLRRVLADPAHAARSTGVLRSGEAKDFIADGNFALDGALPCNTNGGLIGEGYIHGLNLVLEATRQLRGTAVNQVPDAHAVLVTASRTGAVLTAE